MALLRRSGDDAAWLGASALIYVPMTLFCLAWMAYWLPSDVALLRLFGEQPLPGAVFGVGVGVGLSALTQWATPRVGSLGRMARSLSSQLGGLSPITCVGLAALSSVGEELLFRGLLQPGLGIGVATVLFGLAHVPMERDLRVWPLLAMGVGGLLGVMYQWTGGVLAPVMAHFCLNALNLIWLANSYPTDGLRQ